METCKPFYIAFNPVLDTKLGPRQRPFLEKILRQKTSTYLQITNFSRKLQIHLYPKFSQNFGWKRMAIISFQRKDLGFENFYESGIPYGIDGFK